MKENYEGLKLEVIEFETEDIITASAVPTENGTTATTTDDGTTETGTGTDGGTVTSGWFNDAKESHVLTLTDPVSDYPANNAYIDENGTIWVEFSGVYETPEWHVLHG